MIIQTDILDSEIDVVSVPHQISFLPAYSNGAGRQSIPSQTQSNLPQTSAQSYPKMGGNRHHPQPNDTYPSSGTSQFSGGQFPQYDYHSFAPVVPISANSVGSSTIMGQYSSNNVGSSTTVGQYSGSDCNLFPHYPAVGEEGRDQDNNGGNGYYQW